MARVWNMLITNKRRGAIAIMAAFLLIVIIGMAAMAIDIGYIMMTRTEMQAAADSCCLAGGTELLDGLGIEKTKTPAEVDTAARAAAVDYGTRNHAGDLASVYVDNQRDVELGRGYFDTASGTWVKEWGVTPYNMVGVDVHRDQGGSGNGDQPLPLILAPVIGTDEQNLVTRAVCVQMPVKGFYVPPGSEETSNIMPFGLAFEDWYQRYDAQEWFEATPNAAAMLDPAPPVGLEWTSSLPDGEVYDATNPLFYNQEVDTQGNLVFDGMGNPVWKQVLFDNFGKNAGGTYTPPAAGQDGVLEIVMYPIGNEPGNYGTIDLGHLGNSADDIRDQIVNGLNADDYAVMEAEGLLTDGELVVSLENPVYAEGDTGISNGPITQALNEILGEPRAIALFTDVQNPGNNAIYELVEFVGVRTMDVQTTGTPKQIWLQPATLVDGSGVPDLDDPPGDDDSIFTPLILIE